MELIHTSLSSKLGRGRATESVDIEGKAMKALNCSPKLFRTWIGREGVPSSRWFNENQGCELFIPTQTRWSQIFVKNQPRNVWTSEAQLPKGRVLNWTLPCRIKPYWSTAANRSLRYNVRFRSTRLSLMIGGKMVKWKIVAKINRSEQLRNKS